MRDLNAPALTEQQLTAFERDGFLAIDRLVDPADLQEIEAEYEQLLDRLDLLQVGRIDQTIYG